jgi:hypothetical protein
MSATADVDRALAMLELALEDKENVDPNMGALKAKPAKPVEVRIGARRALGELQTEHSAVQGGKQPSEVAPLIFCLKNLLISSFMVYYISPSSLTCQEENCDENCEGAW